MAQTLPLTSRPLDLLYFGFFAMHIPATLLLDLQSLYPATALPKFISQLPYLYIKMTSDPLIAGAMGVYGNNDHFIWFKSFLCLEAAFQLPVFFLGMYGLWKDSRSIYILLLVYGISTATTTFPCVAVILTTPLTSPDTILNGVFATVTSQQRLLLLSSYLPFFLLPLYMGYDMVVRISRLAALGIAAEDAKRMQ